MKLAERAALIMKKAALMADPQMDSVAVALNCTPTYHEIQAAKYWIIAIERAKDEMAKG